MAQLALSAYIIAALPTALRNAARQSYGAELTFLPLVAGGGAQSKSLTIVTGAWLAIGSISGTVTTTAAPPVLLADVEITVNLTTISSGVNLQQNASHWQTMVGTAQNPFILPMPMLIPPGSTLQVTLTPLNVATSYNVDLNFQGLRIAAPRDAVPGL